MHEKPVTVLRPPRFAAQGGDAALVRCVLAAGGAADATDHDGRTPLHWAALYDRGAAVCRALVAHGSAALAPRDADGATPLDLAKSARHTAVEVALRALAKEDPERLKGGGEGEHHQSLLEDIESFLGGADPDAPAAPRDDDAGTAGEEEPAADDVEGAAPEHHRRASAKDRWGKVKTEVVRIEGDDDEGGGGSSLAAS